MKTPHKHAELIKAWADGAEIECKGTMSGDWVKSHTPSWFNENEYRIKFWSVTGKFERQAFANLSGAEAYCKGLNATHPEGGYIVRPLLETPAPKRPWVGLTAADMRDISLICIDKVDAMLMTEDKLEEKNYD